MSQGLSNLDVASSKLLLLNQASALNPGDKGQMFSGGRALFIVWLDGTVPGATYNGSNVTLQFSPDNGASWIPYGGAAFTSNGSALVYLLHGWRIRALIATAAPTGLNAALYYMPDN